MIYLQLFSFRLSPEGVDIVLDCMCGEDANKGISLLKPMGKYILYGKTFFFVLIQFYVPFKIISAHMRWANQ